MTPKEFFGEELEAAIREYVVLVKQSTPEERIQIAESLRTEAVKQEKDIVRRVIIKLAEYAETTEDSE